MEWKDATIYSRIDRDKKPNSWRLQTPMLGIWVSTGHSHYPGEWIYTCHAVGVDAKPLNLPPSATPEQAQKRAVAWVKARLQKMIDSLEPENQPQ